MMENKYCRALAELRSKPAHELKEVGDQWRTPDLLFWGINAMFGPLVLDLFADDSNAKCLAWYTAEDNALTQDWSERLAELGGAGFGNPPYSRSQYHDKQAVTGMTHIINHAMAMREKGGRYVFLIKSATNETWWPVEADHVTFIRGRIGFDLPTWFVPKDEKQQPTSAFFAGAIVVFDKTWRGERFSYINRTDLEAKGRAAMSLAQFAVGRTQTDAAPELDAEVVPEKSEAELPLTQKAILETSGVEAWACVVAAFGKKDEYTFSESKFGHTWAADSLENPEFTNVSPLTIDRAKKLISESILVGVNAWLETLPFDSEDEWLVTIEGVKYQIVDIGMRMLQPHELYKAQGFPDGYVIDQDYRGNRYAKDKQVARCGNAVPPPFARALVEANLPELCANQKAGAAA